MSARSRACAAAVVTALCGTARAEPPQPAPDLPPTNPQPAPSPEPGPTPTPTPTDIGGTPAPAVGSAGTDAPPVQTITVHGRVINALNKPIAGAIVQLEDHSAQATTDKRGRFAITGAAIGSSLIVDAQGYATGLGTVGGEQLDDIVLLTESQSTEVINVSGSAAPTTAGSAKLDRTDIERVPGTGGDLVRTLTLMPGIVNSQLPIGFGGLVIRGSAPEDSKILIDGFEVPLLYHAIGFRAIIPTEAIASLDYVPGGFDVSFGRAASGIVSLTTRPGSDQRTEQAEISVIDGGILIQGKADQKTRYMLAFRRSTIDLLLPHIIPSSVNISLTTVPHYYDLQARVDRELSSHWKAYLSSIGSDDALEIFGDKTMNPDKRFFDETRFLRTTAGLNWHDDEWTGFIATSVLLQELVFDIGAVQHLDIRSVSDTTRGEISRVLHNTGGLADLTWRLGGEAAITRYSLDLALPTFATEGEGRQTYNPNDVSTQFDGIVYTPDFAAWTALVAGLTPAIHATASLRADYFARGDALAIQPRSELSIKLSPIVTARLSAGEYRRPPENQAEFLHANLKPEKATQVIAGVSEEPWTGARIQESLYYTNRTDLITTNDIGQLANNGTGVTYGAELLATYKGGPWFAWLSYSYSHSTRVAYPGQPTLLFTYDQPHSLNAALSWEHKKWTLGTRFELYSGLPQTPVTGSVFISDINLYEPIYGKINSERAPLHDQLDVRVDRRFHWGPVLMTFFIDIQNVYLDQSITQYIYSYDYSQRSAFKAIPIIPSIGLRGVL